MNLKEIAKAAKVSPSTVSLVLNDKGGVSPRTREHVATLLCENGYNINHHKPEVQQKSIRFLKYSRHSHLVNGNAASSPRSSTRSKRRPACSATTS